MTSPISSNPNSAQFRPDNHTSQDMGSNNNTMKLLVPTDFSEHSQAAIQYAVALAKKTGAEITLINTWHITPTNAEFAEYNTLASYQLIAEASTEGLANLKTALQKNHQVSAQAISREGFAADVIPAVMEEINADITVIGSRGFGGVGRALLGSVASRVIDHCTKPVLVVPATAAPGHFSEMAFATGFHDSDTDHLKSLITIARAYGSRITIVHFNILSKDPVTQAFFSEYEKTVREKLGYENLAFKLIEGDDLNESVDQFISSHRIDLFALSSMKRSAWQRLFDPSLTKHELGHLQSPLMVFTGQD